MVKRKWLWGKRSSGEIESSGSMSTLSDKFLEDQDASKRSPSNTPLEGTLGAYGETNGEETNDSSPTLTRTSSDCLTKENLEMDRSTERLSDAEVDDRAEDRLTKEYLSIITLDRSTERLSEAQVDGGIDSSFQENLSKRSMDETELEHAATETSSNCKEDNGSLKLLTEKLSAALLNVSIKDDLVKQHSKVAEEAVAGWEKAENEVATLKQQLETAVQQKSGLENRVSHLDEALKECVRQLRLARDEQERKILQAVAEKTNELEIAKTKLEHQLVELQVENSRVSSPDPELLQKLEILERENLTLRKELQSQSEELEVRTIERDLSTKAAETASKQHLESIKKLAKLEAECRKLKSLSRNDHKLTAVASSYVESLTDSQSDSSEHLSTSESDSRKINGVGLCERNTNQSESWAAALIAELDQFKSDKLADKNMHASPMEIDLMDDFLEMERLAALPPDGKPKVHSAHPDHVNEKPVPEAESKLRTELESVINRTAELEEKIEKLELEKTELSLTLAQTQDCLEKSQFQLIETHMKLEELERELHGANEAEEFYKAEAVSYEKEAELMSSQIKSLKADIDREQILSVEKSIRCEELENELEKVKAELEIQKGGISDGELKIKEIELAQAKECLEKSRAQLWEAGNKLEELQKKLDEGNEEKKSLKSQLDSMRTEKSIRCEELENELEKIKVELEIQKGAISDGDLKRKESELAQTRECLEKSQVQLREAQSKLEELQKELDERNEAEISLKSQLDSMRTEVQTMSTQTESLKEQVHKEQALAAELSTKCQELEIELLRRRQELEVQQKAHSNNELKIKQEDLVAAAGKLADCQKTIASLGSQLKSLATLEDFLIDTAGIPGFSPPAPLMARHTEDLWRLHSNHTFLPEKEYEPLSNSQEGLSPFANHNRRDNRHSPASSSSSTSSAYFMNPPGSEKNGNGFAKYFALSRN